MNGPAEVCIHTDCSCRDSSDPRALQINMFIDFMTFYWCFMELLYNFNEGPPQSL